MEELADWRRTITKMPVGSASGFDDPNQQDAITIVDRPDGKLLLKFAHSPRGAYLYHEIILK
ncbi:MAG: hypothetical protein FJ261_06960 [Planctomycetes bacterium]|nr:hypothetical protein [Planctomycetota bacterium]